MDHAEGRSLAPLLQGKKLEYVHVFSESTRPKSASIEQGVDWVNARKCKGVWGPMRHLQNCPRLRQRELFDFHTDPGETNDLLAADPVNDEEQRRADKLFKRLKKWAAIRGEMETREHGGADVTAQLEALGYVNGQ